MGMNLHYSYPTPLDPAFVRSHLDKFDGSLGCKFYRKGGGKRRRLMRAHLCRCPSGERRAVLSGIAVTQSIRQTSTINVIGSNVMSLKGKVAIVTGGNSGIGLSIVLELAKQGANIVIDYVCHPEATEALEKQVAALGDQVIGVKADVSKVAELQSLIDTAVKNLGRLDIMVNNAGVETRTSVLDTTEEQYEKVLAINLKSAF